MNRAIFLDRDDTLIHNDGDLGDPDGVILIKGVASAIASLRGLGYKIIVISNQGGVARGKYGEADVDAVNHRIAELIKADAGATIDRFYYCPFHPEGMVEAYKREHSWRKPAPGMILQAAEDMRLDLHLCWTIGDQARDIEAGAAAGTRTIFLADPKDAGVLLADATAEPNAVARTLADAVRYIAQRPYPERKAKKPARPTRARAKKVEIKTQSPKPVPAGAAQSKNPFPPWMVEPEEESTPEPPKQKRGLRSLLTPLRRDKDTSTQTDTPSDKDTEFEVTHAQLAADLEATVTQAPTPDIIEPETEPETETKTKNPKVESSAPPESTATEETKPQRPAQQPDPKVSITTASNVVTETTTESPKTKKTSNPTQSPADPSTDDTQPRHITKLDRYKQARAAKQSIAAPAESQSDSTSIPPQTISDTQVTDLLEQIHRELRSQRAEFDDFSIFKTVAAVIQMLTVGCTIFAFAYLGSGNAFLNWIAGAILGQLIVITLLLADKKK